MPPDELDIIQDRLEKDEELRRKYTPKPAEIKGTGRCLYCNAEIDKDRRWCDADCRTDYEYMMIRKK